MKKAHDLSLKHSPKKGSHTQLYSSAIIMSPLRQGAEVTSQAHLLFV